VAAVERPGRPTLGLGLAHGQRDPERHLGERLGKLHRARGVVHRVGLHDHHGVDPAGIHPSLQGGEIRQRVRSLGRVHREQLDDRADRAKLSVDRHRQCIGLGGQTVTGHHHRLPAVRDQIVRHRLDMRRGDSDHLGRRRVDAHGPGQRRDERGHLAGVEPEPVVRHRAGR
jgi:hypothetical protein